METVTRTLHCHRCGGRISRVPEAVARQVQASTCRACNEAGGPSFPAAGSR